LNREQTYIPKGKRVYFASDFHLGIPDYASSLQREKKLVQWLDHVKSDAYEVYLMGDIFDFWYEYKTAVPKGYVRFLGKITELTDAGIPVYVFRGNHDIWAFDYLEKECGAKLYRKPLLKSFNEKVFLLTHGDGLGPGDNGYKFLKKVFEFPLNQWLFRWIHPDWGTRLGLFFSRRSRLANIAREQKEGDGRKNEDLPLWHYAKQMKKEVPEIDYFIFGHNHLMRKSAIDEEAAFVLLGDWINYFSYAVFDGNTLELLSFKQNLPD
jgi:UDP-2,3-diacylglucosamine hydrolase